MKKAKSGKRIVIRKSSVPRTVEQYVSRLPEHARGSLEEMRAAIRSVVPAGATEVISYRMPAFKHKRVLVWYAAFSKHCSLFPTAAVIEAFQEELKGYTGSRGTVHFELDKPLPIALIKRMVKLRVEQAKPTKRR
jgi:uncharacterized protein YdhG (YjbR/CyaY superfamily)